MILFEETLYSSYSSLMIVQSELKKIFIRNDFSFDLINQSNIIIEELLLYIIKKIYNNDKTKKIKLCCSLENNELIILIEVYDNISKLVSQFNESSINSEIVVDPELYIIKKMCSNRIDFNNDNIPNRISIKKNIDEI